MDGTDATGSSVGSATASNGQPFTIGGRGVLRDILDDIILPAPQPNADPRVPGYMLVGTLNELALYNVALTPAQVLAHWNARAT